MAKRENYNDLYLFMQVVREGSFTAAAQRLGLAQSGISRAVRELEERLGVQLLVRTTRRLSLTQAGEQLYHNVESGFDALDMGLATLAHYRQTPSGTVRINASQHAIDKVLLPKLAIFKQRYPDIRLELITESRFVDIIAERFDAGVRLGPEVGSGMIAVRISPDMEMAVVGTPEHFRRYGFPQTPADLTGHPCIAYQFGDGSLYAWELNVEGKKLPTRLRDSGLSPTAIWRPKRRGWGWDWLMSRRSWSQMICNAVRLSGCSSAIASVWKVHFSITRTEMCRPR